MKTRRKIAYYVTERHFNRSRKVWEVGTYPVYYFSWSYRYAQSRGFEFRQGTSYRRNPEHKKKELTNEEINRRLWRKAHSERKDRYYRRGIYRSFCKNHSNRLERRMVRQLIHHEEWDRLSNVTYKELHDPWNWD